MCSLKSLRLLMDESGEPVMHELDSQSPAYSADWQEVRNKAAEVVRERGYNMSISRELADMALNLLGIPSQRAVVGKDGAGSWVVSWR